MTELYKAICACDERTHARNRGEFVFSEDVGAWIFPNDAPRRVRNSWLLVYREMESHAEEPYRWICCPFCGGDLPPQDSFNPYLGTEGATDGDGPE